MKKGYLFIAILFLLAGCNNNNVENSQQSENRDDTPHVTNVKNSTIEEVDRKTGQDIAKRLVSLATSIENVNDATAVVIGKYALVGVDINADLDRSEVGSIKYSVAESLKSDPDGANAVIIADPDMNARLKEIGEDIQNGKPIQGIFNELADISGRLIPEVPADMIKNEPDGDMKKPNEKLNEEEEKELKNDQDEQSNNHIRD
ncbi:YhcN/YlaJ family sporulation lipoprotein [Niallia circulans]|uniref:YhcN/YlaJ family sporulation lipoprotein n=1 Tax=Niallia circulans TaxID=1397 RepID=UPI001F201715|nr:YhcN/YlaJ family sporulation lipoprotein [Niallia circulans]MCF2650504.1 YhcN/YlaJ family sporulation lipoprotein [Niallia circulans]